MDTNVWLGGSGLISVIFVLSACSSPQLIEISPYPTPVSTTIVPSLTAELPSTPTHPEQLSTSLPPTVGNAPTNTIQPSPKSQPTAIVSDECIHITDAVFDEIVLESPLPVVVDFWAPWCGPCKVLAPILDQLAEEYAGKLLIARVNTDENPDWAMKLGVQGIPTIIFFVNGEVVHRQVGAPTESMLQDMIGQLLEDVAQPTPNP